MQENNFAFIQAKRVYPRAVIIPLGDYYRLTGQPQPGHEGYNPRLPALCEDLGRLGLFLLYILSIDPDKPELLTAGDTGEPRMFSLRDYDVLVEQDLRRKGINRAGRKDQDYRRAKKKRRDELDALHEKQLEANRKIRREQIDEIADETFDRFLFKEIYPREFVPSKYEQVKNGESDIIDTP
jgi:hypothetical protein